MQHEDAVAVFQRVSQVMGHHQRGQSLLPHQPAGQLHDDLRGLGVQRRGVLVQNEELNGGERTHQKGQRLPLPAGERAHGDIELVLQPQPQRAQQLFIIGNAAAVHAGGNVVGTVFVVGHGHVFKQGHRAAGAHGGVLVHTANVAVALVLAHFGNIAAAHENAALVHGDGAADQVEHAGFAAAVGANDADELPVRDGQAEMAEQAVFVHRSGGIDLAYITKLKHGISPSSCAHCPVQG